MLVTVSVVEIIANEDAAMHSLGLGVQLFGQGQHAKAIPHIQRAIELEPRSWPVAYFNLGMAHLELKQHRHALAAFLAASRVQPSDSELRSLLQQSARGLCEGETAEATVAAAQGAVQQAERQLEVLIRQVPRCIRALETLGPLQLMAGKGHRALGVLLRALQVAAESLVLDRNVQGSSRLGPNINQVIEMRCARHGVTEEVP